jgi:hypothetical protein
MYTCRTISDNVWDINVHVNRTLFIYNPIYKYIYISDKVRFTCITDIVRLTRKPDKVLFTHITDFTYNGQKTLVPSGPIYARFTVLLLNKQLVHVILRDVWLLFCSFAAFFSVPCSVPRSAINLVCTTGMPSEPLGPLFCSRPPRSSSVGGSGSSSRQRGDSSGSPSQGGTTMTKKPSKLKKVSSHEQAQLASYGPLSSKPAAAADSFGTYPVSRALTAASGQHSLTEAYRISASNRGDISGGNPLVFILKPPKSVTSGFPAGDSPFPVALSRWPPPEVSPCMSPCRVSPWGLATPWLNPSPSLLSEGPPHTCERDGRGLWAGWAGTLAAYPFPAPPPPGFGQVVLPDFASLLRSVSSVLVELSPGGSQADPGQKYLRQTQFLAYLRDTSPPSRLSLGTPSQPSAVGTRLDRLAPRCLPAGVCWNTTQLSPLSWVILHPRLIGSHLTTASTPDCCPGRVLEVMPFLGAGQPSRIGIGPETHGSPGTLGLLSP